LKRRIPLFPLPGVVLLPGTILLHIFDAVPGDDADALTATA
jgi:Lon protease-like protein